MVDLVCQPNCCSCQNGGCIQFVVARASNTRDAVFRKPCLVRVFKSCGVARCSDWKMSPEVGEGENTSGCGLRMCVLTLFRTHWPRQWLHVLAPVYRCLEESRSPVSSGPPEHDFTVLADVWHVTDQQKSRQRDDLDASVRRVRWRSKLQQLRK